MIILFFLMFVLPLYVLFGCGSKKTPEKTPPSSTSVPLTRSKILVTTPSSTQPITPVQKEKKEEKPPDTSDNPTKTTDTEHKLEPTQLSTKRQLSTMGGTSAMSKIKNNSQMVSKRQQSTHQTDDGGYEQCPDMTPEELAKLI